MPHFPPITHTDSFQSEAEFEVINHSGSRVAGYYAQNLLTVRSVDFDLKLNIKRKTLPTVTIHCAIVLSFKTSRRKGHSASVRRELVLEAIFALVVSAM